MTRQLPTMPIRRFSTTLATDAAAGSGRQDAVQEQVAAIAVHQRPDGLVVVLEMLIQMLDEAVGELHVLAPRIAQLRSRQWGRHHHVVLAVEIVEQPGLVEQ